MRDYLYLFLVLVLFACGDPATDTAGTASADETKETSTGDFVWQTETFADIGILRYQIPGFDKLSVKQKDAGLLPDTGWFGGAGYYL